MCREWLARLPHPHLVSNEETHTQVRNAFTAALQAQGLLDAARERADTGRSSPTSTTG